MSPRRLRPVFGSFANHREAPRRRREPGGHRVASHLFAFPNLRRTSMSTRLWRTALPGLAAALASIGQAGAHEIVGNRFFPATLNIDDPGVNDELAIPTVSYFKNGDNPPAKQLDVSGEFAKRITESFAISVGANWTRLKPSWMPAVSGFQNVETLFKYRVYRNPEHEFVMSVGLGVEWGGTGS